MDGEVKEMLSTDANIDWCPNYQNSLANYHLVNGV